MNDSRTMFKTVLVWCVLLAAGCTSGAGSGDGGVPTGGGALTFDAGGVGTVTDSVGAKQEVGASCVNDCDTPGKPFCTATGKVAQCIAGADGCNHAGTPEACDAGSTCEAGKCKPSTCTPNCSGKACDVSDGCGGTCGCSGGLACVAGKCALPCTKSDNYCMGDVLQACGPAGALVDQQCSTADCVASGYLAYSNCGANAGGTTKCLCIGCTANDTGCDGNIAQVCDEGTGKLSSQVCPADKVCNSGACVTQCKDECAGDSCVGGKVVACVKGSDGCKKKLSPATCTGGKVCSAGGAGCDDCSKQSDCAADEVCTVLSSCTYYGAGTSYDITINSVTFPVKDESGAAWDSFGGLPDPMICVYDDTTKLGCTSTKNDVLDAYFFETITVSLSSTSKLCLIAWDVDVSSNDNADGSCWQPWIGLVKAGGNYGFLYNNIVQVDFTIKPTY